jgi:hypothetical protein
MGAPSLYDRLASDADSGTSQGGETRITASKETLDADSETSVAYRGFAAETISTKAKETVDNDREQFRGVGDQPFLGVGDIGLYAVLAKRPPGGPGPDTALTLSKETLDADHEAAASLRGAVAV